MSTPERKYVLTKVAAGDYLLPGNDGQSLWRLRTYTDGPSFGLTHMRADKDFWCVRKWTGEVGPGAYVDIADEDRWELWETGHETRAAAIASVVKQSEPK